MSEGALRQRAFRFSFVLTCAAALMLPAGQSMAQGAKPPLRIGTLYSMTGGGVALATAAMAGTKLAAKEINDAGGILGRQVELVQGDDQSDPTAAVNEIQRLVTREKVDLVMGPSVTQFVLATLPTTTRAKVMQFSTGGGLQLTPEAGPYHFSMNSSGREQGTAMADYAADVLKVKTAALLVDNGSNSKDIAQYAVRRLAERGITLTGQQEYAFRTDDITPQLLSLKRGNPEVILYNTVSPEDLANLLKARRDLGWNVPIAGGVTVALFGPNAMKITGQELFNGVAGISNIGFTYCGNDAVGQSPFAKYVQRMAAFPAAGDVRSFSPASSSLLYDALYILKAAAEGTGGFDAARMSDWIEANGSKLVSLSGPLYPSKTSHLLLGAKTLVAVERPYETRSDGLQKRAGC
jgi:ABC-type branched-subunit amino acid transport system substrate-binding protein